MRLYEVITIYLAAGSPVGVVCFLRYRATRHLSARVVARAAAAWLLWPAAIIRLLSARRGELDFVRAKSDPNEQSHELKIERAARALVAALHAVEDALDETGKASNKAHRQTIFAALRSAERYTGLASVAAQEKLRSDETPTKREMETCRVAGRAGDDLLIAGLCVRRRGRARLFAHRDRACAEFVHALAGVRTVIDRESFAAPREIHVARSLSKKLISVYASAIEVLALLDEQTKTVMVARLLDAECARLRRLETAGIENARQPESPFQPAIVERCP